MEEDLLQGPEDDPPGRDVIIIFAVFFEAGLAPFSLFLGWLMGHQPVGRVRVEPDRRPLGGARRRCR